MSIGVSLDAHYNLCKHGQKALDKPGFKGQQGEKNEIVSWKYWLKKAEIKRAAQDSSQLNVLLEASLVYC